MNTKAPKANLSQLAVLIRTEDCYDQILFIVCAKSSMPRPGNGQHLGARIRGSAIKDGTGDGGFNQSEEHVTRVFRDFLQPWSNVP